MSNPKKSGELPQRRPSQKRSIHATFADPKQQSSKGSIPPGGKPNWDATSSVPGSKTPLIGSHRPLPGETKIEPKKSSGGPKSSGGSAGPKSSGGSAGPKSSGGSAGPKSSGGGVGRKPSAGGGGPTSPFAYARKIAGGIGSFASNRKFEGSAGGVGPRSSSPHPWKSEGGAASEDAAKLREKMKGKMTEEGYSKTAVSSLLPIRIVMLLFGSFPFTIEKKKTHYWVEFKTRHLNHYYFVGISIIITLITVLFLINFCSVVTNVPKMQANGIKDYYVHDRDYNYMIQYHDPGFPLYVENRTFDEAKSKNHTVLLRAEERYIFYRNQQIFVSVSCVYLRAVLTCGLVYYRRKYVAHFFTLMLEACNICRIDMALGVGRFMWFLVVSMLLIFVGMRVCTEFYPVFPIIGGGRTMLVLMAYRVFYPPIHTMNHHGLLLLKNIHSIFFYFSFFTGKVYIFLFIWCCELIRNGFRTLNARMELSLNDAAETKRSEYERSVHRTLFTQLFADHVLLLDLIAGVDRMFKGIMEVYVFTEVADLCFKAFYIFKCLTSADVKEIDGRRHDVFIVAPFTIAAAVLLYHIVNSAASVNHEADEGLEILRRRGLMGEKSAGELQFLLSMYLSYSGHFDIAIVCGNYIKFNRRVGVLLMSTFFIFVIIIAEINPKYRLTEKQSLNLLQCYCRIPVPHPMSEHCGCYSSGPTGDPSQPFTTDVILWQTETDVLDPIAKPTYLS